MEDGVEERDDLRWERRLGCSQIGESGGERKSLVCREGKRKGRAEVRGVRGREVNKKEKGK